MSFLAAKTIILINWIFITSTCF